MAKLFKSYLVILFLTIFNFNFSFTQIEYNSITGVKGNQVDTFSIQNSQKVLSDNLGLLEKEIETQKYIVGPGDEFTISILNANSRDIISIVTPDGSLVIPKVGLINLKQMTLFQTYINIKEKVKSIYKAEEVNVALTKMKKFKVIVSGAVLRPNIVSASSVDRVSEVIERVGGFNKESSIRKIILIRNEGKEEINVDLMKFHYNGDKSHNPLVQGGDQIIVYPMNKSLTIGIYGDVSNPGEFEFLQGDSLSTLLKFAQGFYSSALLDSVIFVRNNKSNNTLVSNILDLSTWEDNKKLEKNILDFPLEVGDRFYFKKIENWNVIKYVVISGEVKYPGKYALSEGKDRVLDLLALSGGFSDRADLSKITFIRQSEFEIVDDVLKRLEKTQPSEMSQSEVRYFQAKINEKKGVMSIDFNKLMTKPDISNNIVLRNKDSVVVPYKKDYINVQGRVNNPGFITFNANFTYEDYIALAGGFGFRSDPDETFITKSKGEQFLAKKKDYKIEPGDAILVPPIDEKTFFQTFKEVLLVTTQLITVAGILLTITK